MTNLALVFPDLAPASFLPWASEAEAQAAGVSSEEYAEKQATIWREGLESNGIGPDRLQALKDAADVTIYTPGSTASAAERNRLPAGSRALLGDGRRGAARRDRGARSRACSRSSGSPPTRSRAASTCALEPRRARMASRPRPRPGTLIGEISRRRSASWASSRSTSSSVRRPDEARVHAQRAGCGVRSPPGAMASRSIPRSCSSRPREAALRGGVPRTSRRRASVRRHARVLEARDVDARTEGTPDLRALAYMDEVFGYVPRPAAPPAKPILTIFKRGRAFGLGLVLSHTEPCRSRLQGDVERGHVARRAPPDENDKARVLEGLRSAAGGTDVAELDRAIGGLGKRRFLLVSAGRPPLACSPPTLGDV